MRRAAHPALFEQYVIEGGGEKIFSPRPGSLGVVPVRGSLKPELMELMEPHLDIDAHFKRHERFLVIDCVCKREQEVLGNHDCKMPMKRCDFVGLPPQTPLGETVLDRDEALKLFGELEQMGHVHLAFYGFTMGAEAPQFVGTCNCCGDCCGILRGATHLGLQETAQRSNYRAVIDPEECISCGVCIERCPVKAIAGPAAFAQGAAVRLRGRAAGIAARQFGGGPCQMHRVRRVRYRLPDQGDRAGAGL